MSPMSRGPGNEQGCGLGLNVSVSRRSRDVPTSRLGLVSTGEANVSVSGGERLGLLSVSSFYVSCPSLVMSNVTSFLHSAQRLDLCTWCVRLSRLLIFFRTHFISLHFHSFISFIPEIGEKIPQSAYLTIFGLAVTLTFNILTSGSNQFSVHTNCTYVVKLMKFASVSINEVNLRRARLVRLWSHQY